MTLSIGPLNAFKPTTSFVIGGVYNATSPAPVSGQACAFQLDANGNLKIAGSFSGGNAAAGPTGSAVPADADYIGFNSGGNLVGVSSVNPLPISGSISATNPSVSATGSAVPADATAIGVEDGSGNLQIASSANPVRIDPTGTTIQPVSGTLTVKGNVASGSAVSGSNAPVLVAGQDGTDVRTLLASSTGQLHVIVDSGGGGGTQYTDETAETAGAFTVTAAGLYNGTDVVGLRGDSSNNLYVNVHVALPAGTNNIGLVTAVGSAASGAAVAGNPVLVAGQDGTDARTLLTSNTGQLVVVGAGTAGSSSGGVISIQGVASGTAVPVSGTFYQATQPVSIASGQVASGAFASGSIASGAIASGAIASGAIAAGAAAAGAFADGSIYVRSNAASTFPVTASIAAAQTLATVTTVSTVTAVTAITNAVTVVGDAASGSAVAGNPVLVAGQDGTDARTFLTDNTGQLKVLVQNTPSVTGSGVFEVGPTSSANTLSNQFFNQLTDGTHGVGINGTSYSSTYGLNVNLLGLDGAVLSASNPLFTELTDGTNAMGAMTNFGTTPTAVKALSANVSLFQGTTAVGAGAPLQVSLANTGSNGTAVAVTGTITAITSITNPVTVVGDAANGLTAAGNPVLVAGWDGLYVRTIATDSVGDVNTTFYNVEADAVASASWTSATSVNTTLSVLSIGFGNATFGVTTTGTVTPGVLTFEATADGVNWVPLAVEGIGATANPILTYTLSGGTAVWQMFVGGLDKIRIRLSTAITGGGTAVVWIRPSVMGTEFAQAVYQSSAANLNATVVGSAASGSAVAGNPVLVAGQDGTDARTLLTSSTGQLHVLADSGSTTAVTQATAANLNATVVPGGSAIFEVSPTTSANTVSNQFFNQLTDGTHGVTINSTTYTSKYGLDVNILGVKGAVFSATNPLFNTPTDGTNAMGTMTAFGSTPSTAYALNANVSLFQGTVAVGTGAPLQVSLANTATNATPVSVAQAASTSGGSTPKGYHISSNAVQAIKSSAGQLYGYYLDNTANAATTYFQFFNIASGSVSLGSSSPLFVIPVPAGSAANLSMSPGWVFGTAMSFAATTTYNGSTFAASAVDCTIAYN